MKFIKVFSILALSSMFMSSCSTSSNAINIKNISIYNTNWRLIKDDNSIVRGFNGENVTLNINDKTFNVTGFAGCNNFSSTITTDNDKIKFAPITSTEITCPNYKIEDSFLDLLDDVNRYEIKGSELCLYKNNFLLFKFIK